MPLLIDKILPWLLTSNKFPGAEGNKEYNLDTEGYGLSQPQVVGGGWGVF